MPITEQNYIDAAAQLECEVNVIKSVAAIESTGSGFLPTGEIKILFEPHIFWRQLIARRIDPKVILLRKPELHSILYPVWGTYPYGHPSEQWDRLRTASQVNIDAAYCSASYGEFQIMGFNYGKAGYSQVFEMTHDFEKGEEFQLKAFIAFIKSTGLQSFLTAKNWKDFARNYNGPGYRNSPATTLDDYDYKLATMYKKLSA